MNKPERIHTYQDLIFDSTRWDSFRPRKGDIIVATPAKCGTTWTQMLCALLVHQTPDLPLPLTRLSRWLDRHGEPIEALVAEFEAQPWRRIVKTHTPLDGLPYYEDATYVFCGRDPRDAFLSAMDHGENASPKTRQEVLRRAGLPPDFELPSDANAMFPMWLNTGTVPWVKDGFPSGSVLYFSSTWWQHRHLPNLVFIHYADLIADIDGEMRKLSTALGIPVDEARWPVLVSAARFETMKENADHAAPGAHLGEWANNADFFRKARHGEWRDRLSPENQAMYEQIAGERLAPELRAWLEGGRKAFDPRA
ncbi:MAG TPA: sulfotransferase domain-containing protein [Rhizomicrobium sp.]|nr:sulfotransferase domain-containing protein [Rhizomicrobium sp.]